jgi:pyruvate ferredoxin oxidoreductase alpha subunit
MAEAVYNASGLGLPIVMTVANRAIGAPINIWNDHTDSMSMRDAGWIQLFAESNQEALDLHIQAFKLAERLSQPVMVCMDGFILTHAYERVDMPTQEQVDAFLPTFEPRQVLDPANPYSIGAMVGPEAFTEVRYLAHDKQRQALGVIPEIRDEFEGIFGRDSGGLIRRYLTEDADTIIVTLGSVAGTVKDVVDEMRDAGKKIGVVTICSFRPFPTAQLRTALAHARQVVVLEKSFAVGFGGVVSNNIMLALQNTRTQVNTVVAGLGGRPITMPSLHKLFEDAIAAKLEPLHFLDLQHDVVEAEIARQRAEIASGPIAENILKNITVDTAFGGAATHAAE